MTQKTTTIIPDYLPILITKELKTLPSDIVGRIMEKLGYKKEPFIDKEAFSLIGDDARRYIKGEGFIYNWSSLRNIQSIIQSSSILMSLAFYPEDSPTP